jgi:hypothetical protein
MQRVSRLSPPIITRSINSQSNRFCTSEDREWGPYNYFAIQNGTDCLCGNRLRHELEDMEGMCDKSCIGIGHETQRCGGVNHVDLWTCDEEFYPVSPPSLPGVAAQNSGLVAADHDRHRRNYRRNHRRKYRSGRGPGLAHVDHGTTLADRTRIHPHLLV